METARDVILEDIMSMYCSICIKQGRIEIINNEGKLLYQNIDDFDYPSFAALEYILALSFEYVISEERNHANQESSETTSTT